MRIGNSAKTVPTDYKDYGLLHRDDGHLETIPEASPVTSYSRVTMCATRLFPLLILASLMYYVVGAATGGGTPNAVIKPYKAAPLQDIVTWDQHSVFVRGERILLYNGEFHPFRLPVPPLWLDIFQKLKAAGFSGVSFYTDW